MRKIFLTLLIVIQGFYAHSQNSSFELGDTIKLSGTLIVDKKEDIIFLKKDIDITHLNKKAIKKNIRKAEFKFIDPFEIKGIIRRNKNISIKFCTAINRPRRIVLEENLINGRYFLIPFKDEFFVIIKINGRKFITYECL